MQHVKAIKIVKHVRIVNIVNIVLRMVVHVEFVKSNNYMLKVKYLLIFPITICISCNRSKSHYSHQERDQPKYQSENEEDESISSDEEENGCGIEDGTYSATVDYNNPNTGYSATYDLDVEVEDCEVVQIDFNNCGYLDEDYISPAEIDSGGDAYVYGDDGKTYNVHIDN